MSATKRRRGGHYAARTAADAALPTYAESVRRMDVRNRDRDESIERIAVLDSGRLVAKVRVVLEEIVDVFRTEENNGEYAENRTMKCVKHVRESEQKNCN